MFSERTELDKVSSISGISFNKTIKINKYFESAQYGNLDFPCKRESDFICVAWNLEKKCYVVLQAIDNSTIELMTAKSRISYPILINGDQEIIFIGGERNAAYLIKYNRQDNSYHKLHSEPVHTESRPLVTNDGTIIITILDQYQLTKDTFDLTSSIIKKLNVDGSIEELVHGRYPVWFEAGKSFFYYDKNKLFLYDILTRQSKLIIQGISIVSQPILSPDKKYIAFDERSSKPRHNSLNVMSVDGRCKKNTVFNYSLIHYHQYDWYQ